MIEKKMMYNFFMRKFYLTFLLQIFYYHVQLKIVRKEVTH